MSFLNYLKEESKSELLSNIKYNVEQIEMRLGQLEKGMDATGEVQFHLDQIKDSFEKIREMKHEEQL
jgi:hypothetical protein